MFTLLPQDWCEPISSTAAPTAKLCLSCDFDATAGDNSKSNVISRSFPERQGGSHGK
jgi:hypothetical protein